MLNSNQEVAITISVSTIPTQTPAPFNLTINFILAGLLVGSEVMLTTLFFILVMPALKN